MNKERCYEIIDSCKDSMNKIIQECNGKDGNAIFLAINLIKDLDRLKKCIDIDQSTN